MWFRDTWRLQLEILSEVVRVNDLLYEGHAIAAVVPPLKDEDEAGDEGGGAGQGHVELGGEGGEEHGGHPEVLADLEGSAEVEEDESHEDEPGRPEVGPGPGDDLLEPGQAPGQ